VFGYAHVPWFKTHQKLIDAKVLAGAAERLARPKLRESHWRPQVTSRSASITLPCLTTHWPNPHGRHMRRNFQGYTIDAADALLPLGVSSIGRLPDGFVGTPLITPAAPSGRIRQFRHNARPRLHA